MVIIISCLFINSLYAQLVISPGSSITIKDGTSLFIGTNLHIKSDPVGSGHLADQNLGGNTNITGDVTVERYLSANGWHNTSSPINTANSSVFAGTDLIFYYDETIILNDWNFGWVWYNGPLSVMKGYDIYLPSSNTANYYTSNGQNLNSGNYSIGVTITNVANGEIENRKGWNLIGNPYPSPVDWLSENAWDKSDINDAKYIWSPNNNNYTIFLGGSNPTGINGGTQYIPSNQGYWVQAIQQGVVHVNNSARVGQTNGTPSYYKTASTNEQELRLLANGNGYSDETMIRFLSTSSSGFDMNMDASKLFTNHDSVPQLYSQSGDGFLAINSLPGISEDLAINLNFMCGTNGYYSICISDETTIDPWQRIYIYDKLTQEITELTNSLEYIFNHNTTNAKARFIIYINPSDDILNSILPVDYFSVNAFNTTLTVIQNTNELYSGQLTIYNVIGQKIASYNFDNYKINTFQLQVPAGYYVASIATKKLVSNYKFRIIR